MEEGNVQTIKKQNNIIIVLLVIIFMAIGVGVGYMIGKGNAPKEEPKDTPAKTEKEEEKQPEEKKEEPEKNIQADYVIQDNKGKKYYIRIDNKTTTTPNYSMTTTYYSILNDQEQEIDKIEIGTEPGTILVAVDSESEVLGRKYELASNSDEYDETHSGQYILYKNGNGEVVNNHIYYVYRDENCTFVDYEVSVVDGKVVKKELKKYTDGQDVAKHIIQIGSAC